MMLTEIFQTENLYTSFPRDTNNGTVPSLRWHRIRIQAEAEQ